MELSTHLQEIYQELLLIILEEKDEEKRQDEYEFLRDALLEDVEKIEQIVGQLSKGVHPGRTASICWKLDQEFIEASYLYLHAIDCMMVFMDEGENPQVIKMAAQSLKKGAELLDRTFEMVQDMVKIVSPT